MITVSFSLEGRCTGYQHSAAPALHARFAAIPEKSTSQMANAPVGVIQYHVLRQRDAAHRRQESGGL